jgi:hypothetical protein
MVCGLDVFMCLSVYSSIMTRALLVFDIHILFLPVPLVLRSCQLAYSSIYEYIHSVTHPVRPLSDNPRETQCGLRTV